MNGVLIVRTSIALLPVTWVRRWIGLIVSSLLVAVVIVVHLGVRIVQALKTSSKFSYFHSLEVMK